MQLKLKFILTFDSDWHIGAGFGRDGKVDSVLERNPQGQPIISGSTLKGLFRDALYDLADNLGKDPNSIIADVLSSTGQDSRWRFNVATPQEKNVPESVISTGVRVAPRYRRAENNKYFTRELGATIDFTFTIHGIVENDEIALRDIEWLIAASSYIQRLGSRRRRGNGNCRITLNDPILHEEILKSFENSHFKTIHPITNKWKDLYISHPENSSIDYGISSHRYRMILYTERPVIIAEKPEAGNVYQGQTIIPGSTLRGAFAAITHPNELNAERYKDFKELFILGGIKFTHLNPMEVSGQTGIPTAQLPLGLQQKEDDKDRFLSVFQILTEQKSSSGWALLKDDKEKVTYQTESHPHVRIDPVLKRASDGDLYTYEAIPAGRYYVGEIYLANKDIKRFADLLQVNINEPFDVWIGKGRNRSYGHCKVMIVPLAEDVPSTSIHLPLEKRLETTPDNELYITLASDTILQDKWGRFYGRFEKECLSSWLGIPIENIEIESPDKHDKECDKRPAQIVRTKLIESFDTRSGLPRWRDKALTAGSTVRVVFMNKQIKSIDVLKKLETEGIGLRRGEGFGRVIFNHPAHVGSWSGFSDAIDIPSKLVNPEDKPTPQNDFIDNWSRILKSLHTGEYKHLWSAKYRDNAQSLARHLVQSLNQPPEEVLEELERISSDIKSEKHNFTYYQEIAYFTYCQLRTVFNECPKYWRKAIILLAEAILNNREKSNVSQ